MSTRRRPRWVQEVLRTNADDSSGGGCDVVLDAAPSGVTVFSMA